MVSPVTVRRWDEQPGQVDWPIVHLPTVITAFATVFLAELPDKTMIATIVLSARFHRPFAVWIGAASALMLQMVIAVTAAQLLRLLPERPVQFAVSGLFAIGAIVLWRSQDEAGDPNEAIADELPQAQAGDAVGPPHRRRPCSASSSSPSGATSPNWRRPAWRRPDHRSPSSSARRWR